MSVHYVYKKDGGAKFMRPILTREEYLALSPTLKRLYQSCTRIIR